MELVKKTVVLAKEKPIGYINLFRVGKSVGAKVVLNSFENGLKIAVKIGGNKPSVHTLTTQKTELSLPDETFSTNDAISCMVFSDEIVAEGGLRRRMKPSDFAESYDKVSAVDALETSAEEIESAANTTTQTETVNDIIIDGSDDNSIDCNGSDDNIGEEEEKSQEFDLLKGLTDKGFYLSVKDKIDELFVIYPTEERLERLIPDSRWIRINYDERDYYVMGLLKDGGKVAYIVYGVPALKAVPPPKGLERICDFFAVNDLPKFDGYYMLFQDINTGELLPK